MSDYFYPALNKQDFNCPYCGVYAHQTWYPVVEYGRMEGSPLSYNTFFKSYGGLVDLRISQCHHCKHLVIWQNEKMIIPRKNVVPPPDNSLPGNIKEIYIEAANVLNDSARASGALMRLALELLLQHINGNTLKLNDNINELIKKNVPGPIIKAASILRVNGNDILHTGEIKVFEKREEVVYLFELFNMIVEELILGPKKLNEFYERIPESVKEKIEKSK